MQRQFCSDVLFASLPVKKKLKKTVGLWKNMINGSPKARVAFCPGLPRSKPTPAVVMGKVR